LERLTVLKNVLIIKTHQLFHCRGKFSKNNSCLQVSSWNQPTYHNSILQGAKKSSSHLNKKEINIFLGENTHDCDELFEIACDFIENNVNGSNLQKYLVNNWSAV